MGNILFLSLPTIRLPREVTNHKWLEAALHFLGYWWSLTVSTDKLALTSFAQYKNEYISATFCLQYQYCLFLLLVLFLLFLSFLLLENGLITSLSYSKMAYNSGAWITLSMNILHFPKRLLMSNLAFKVLSKLILFAYTLVSKILI